MPELNNADSDDDDDDDNAQGRRWTEVPIQEVPQLETRASQHNDFFAALPAFNKRRGPIRTEIPRNVADPIDIFQLYWTPELLEKIVRNSNWYGQRFVTAWQRDLNIAEFKAFLAIILELGVVKFPNRESAFKRDHHGSQFIKVLGISHARFNQILRARRYKDYNKTAEEIREAKAADAFWPIKEMAQYLASQFGKYYQCGRGLDIDEQTRSQSKH